MAKSGWDSTDTHFLIRCGAQGGRTAFTNRLWTHESEAHFDPDANGFLIYAHGDWQAYEEDYRSNPYPKVTETNNTILIDGIGQFADSLPWYWADNPYPDTLSDLRLHDIMDAGELLYLRGDAKSTYNTYHSKPTGHGKDQKMSRADRHVLFVRPDYFIILDDLRSDDSHYYTWTLNTSIRDTIATIADDHYEVTNSTQMGLNRRDGEMDVWLLPPDTSDVTADMAEHQMGKTDHPWPFLGITNDSPTADMLFLMFLETRDATESAVIPTASGVNGGSYVQFDGLDWSVAANESVGTIMAVPDSFSTDAKLLWWRGRADTTSRFFAAQVDTLVISDYTIWSDDPIQLYLNDMQGLALLSGVSTTELTFVRPGLTGVRIDGETYEGEDTVTVTLYEGTSAIALFDSLDTGIAEAADPDSRGGVVVHARPNPAHGVTSISYALSRGLAGPASLAIYDITGREVNRWDLETPQGVIEWNGRSSGSSRVASGVYFYVIQSPDIRLTGKFVLLR